MREDEEIKRRNFLLQRGFATIIGQKKEESPVIFPESPWTALKVSIKPTILRDNPCNLWKHCFDLYVNGNG